MSAVTASAPASAASRVKSATSVATWSLRERAVCSRPPDRARQLGEPPLDGHVDVLVVGREREAALAQLGLDRVQAGQQRVAILLREHPLRGQHARVRARLRDVVGPQAPIEVDRRVQGLEGGILGLAEARHAGGAAYAALRPSAIWATCVARAKPSRYSVMAHPIQAPVPA